MADDKPKLKQRLYDVPVVGVALRMQDRYVDDDADQHAAAIGFFGFLSLFPLLLLALAVAGFVLRGDPQAQAELTDAILRAIPGFADTFQGDDNGVAQAVAGLSRNAGSVGLAGLGSLLLTGLKVVNAANVATLHVFHVDADISGLVRKVRQVGVLTVLGLLAIAGVAATGLVGAAARIATEQTAGVVGGVAEVDRGLQLLATLAGLAGSVAADLLLFVSAYKLLSWGKGPRLRHVWPGALVAAIGWTLLKAFGATYVSNQIAKTNELIGAFGGVVGLLLLLYLAGRIYLYGAEFTALVREPGFDLAHRYDSLTYEGEEDEVIGPVFAARKAIAQGGGARGGGARGGGARGGAADGAPSGSGRRTVLAAESVPSSHATDPQYASRPAPRPVPRPDESSPAVSERTRNRLRELDATRRERREVGIGGPTGLGGSAGEHEGRVHEGRRGDGGADVRGAAAVAVAVGAVGALVAAAKPWKGDA